MKPLRFTSFSKAPFARRIESTSGLDHALAMNDEFAAKIQFAKRCAQRTAAESRYFPRDGKSALLRVRTSRMNIYSPIQGFVALTGISRRSSWRRRRFLAANAAELIESIN